MQHVCMQLPIQPEWTPECATRYRRQPGPHVSRPATWALEAVAASLRGSIMPWCAMTCRTRERLSFNISVPKRRRSHMCGYTTRACILGACRPRRASAEFLSRRPPPPHGLKGETHQGRCLCRRGGVGRDPRGAHERCVRPLLPTTERPSPSFRWSPLRTCRSLATEAASLLVHLTTPIRG